ncbi:hypothetical protein CJ030_MR0G018455 [Morella rubra]|uniref:Uncharacterized protein n=1 Tax=Morella rubra TaxID=262757 RepID=A0A6A1UGI5_9ROSI|nr:hypothetical protein CJ030_MR0G018455 [Morella rubra]
MWKKNRTVVFPQKARPSQSRPAKNGTSFSRSQNMKDRKHHHRLVAFSGFKEEEEEKEEEKDDEDQKGEREESLAPQAFREKKGSETENTTPAFL